MLNKNNIKIFQLFVIYGKYNSVINHISEKMI